MKIITIVVDKFEAIGEKLDELYGNIVSVQVFPHFDGERVKNWYVLVMVK